MAKKTGIENYASLGLKILVVFFVLGLLNFIITLIFGQSLLSTLVSLITIIVVGGYIASKLWKWR